VLTSLFLRFGYGLIFVAAAFEGDAALISGAFLARLLQPAARHARGGIRNDCR
jgi:hypothetical protein